MENDEWHDLASETEIPSGISRLMVFEENSRQVEIVNIALDRIRKGPHKLEFSYRAWDDGDRPVIFRYWKPVPEPPVRKD